MGIRDSAGRAIYITYGDAGGQTPPYNDTIDFTGYNGASRTVTVHWDLLTGANVLRAGYSAMTYPQLFSVDSVGGAQYQIPVVTSVTLPENTLSYQFQYNPYGELARVVLPTGGAYEYDWGGGYDNSAFSSGLFSDGNFGGAATAAGNNVYRRVLTRRTYPDGVTLEGTQTFSGARNYGQLPSQSFHYIGGATTVTMKSFSDGVKPTATWTYDTTFIGKIASSGNGNSGTTYDVYDAMGRPTQTTQTTPNGTGSPYVLKYGYDLAGNTETLSYASGRTVRVCADAGGRPAALTDTSATGAAGAVVTQTWNPAVSNGSATVAALGQPDTTTFATTSGTAMTQAWTYSGNRLQASAIAATGGGKNLLTLQYYHCPSHAASCSTNNGNMLAQLTSADAVGSAAAFSFDQEYGYDALSRVTAAGETGGASEWSQGYVYDLVGNRALVQGSFGASSAQATALAGASASAVNQSFPDNRWTGATHSDAGNVTVQYPTGPGLTYDAEGRMTAATEPNITGPITYAYDADGRRVQKTVGSATTTYVYDAGGELTAEYGGTATGAGLQFVAGDALGSTRLVTDAGGNVVERRDYAPFGEELYGGVGGRDATFGTGTYPVWPPNALDLEFTGKERDAESGLDYFGARYFSSAMGRFTSPDQPFNDQYPGDPQSWNLFSYVRNNPLKFTDLNGQDCVYTNNLSSSGTVGVERGDCSQKGGTFVDGTINTDSLTYNERKGTLSYSYSNGDTIGSGFIAGLPPPVQFPGIEGPDNQAGAAQIAGDSSAGIKTFAGAQAAFATAYLGTYALPAAWSALSASSRIGAIGPGVALLNKLNHIFGEAGHNLGDLVQKYGSASAAYAALEQATSEAVAAQGITGTFYNGISVNVGGIVVTVRGAVVNGVVKIGTAFK